METRIATSIEQSRKLMELGIDIKTADMDYIPFANNPQEYDCVINVWNNEHEKDWIPAWSLTALMNLFDDKSGLAKDYGLWFCYDNGKSHCTKHYETQIDAAFEMVVWLLENNKI